jgi:hypothetical protein
MYQTLFIGFSGYLMVAKSADDQNSGVGAVFWERSGFALNLGRLWMAQTRFRYALRATYQ